jgi:hypothetical protein
MAGSQIIEVPGQGQVEFPAGMSDADIVTAIKKLSSDKKPDSMAGSVMQTPEERFASDRRAVRDIAIGGDGRQAGRALGLTATAAIKAATGIPAMFGDAVGLNTSGAVDRLLNMVGLPTPQTGVERLGVGVASGMAGAGVLSGMARLAQPISMAGQGIANLLTQNMGSQVIGSGAASGASDLAAEMGGGPIMQMAAGLGGGYLGSTAALGGAQTFQRVRDSQNIPFRPSPVGTERFGTGAPLPTFSGLAEQAKGLPSAIGQGMVAATAAPLGLNNRFQNAMARAAGASDNEFIPGKREAFAREGESLARQTGIDLSPGEVSGNRMLLGMENAARQYGPTATKVQAYDVAKANQAVERINAIADKITQRKTPTDALGNYIQETVSSAVKNLDNYRSTTADKDYGQVRKIAGNEPVIKWDNLRAELQNIVDEYKNVAAPNSDAAKIVSQAQQSISKITGIVEPGTAPKTIDPGMGRGTIKLPGEPTVIGLLGNTIDDAMKTRRFYGRAAAGSADIFENVNPNIQRNLAARLFRAIESDFETAPNGLSDPRLRTAFEGANRNYSNITQSIKYIEGSALGKLVGEKFVDPVMNGAAINSVSGEQVVKTLMNADPSTRIASLNIIRNHNPKLADDFKAFVIRDALEKAGNIPPSARGASEMPISFNKFVGALQGKDASLPRQLESFGFSADESKDVIATVRALTRAGDRTGYNYSGTTAQAENIGMVQQGAGVMANLATGSVRAAAAGTYRLAGQIIGMNKIADAMTTAQGRAALQTLARTNASPQAVIAAAEFIRADKQEGQ